MGLLKHLGIFLLFGLDFIFQTIFDFSRWIMFMVLLTYLYIIVKH